MDSARGRRMCLKHPRSRPKPRFGGFSSLNNRHRALECVLYVFSSNLCLSGYHAVTNSTLQTRRMSPAALKTHPSSTFHRVPALVGRISLEPLGRFWICKLRWKGIFKGFKEGAIGFLIRLETKQLERPKLKCYPIGRFST